MTPAERAAPTGVAGGTRWGEGGFVRVLRGANLLGLEEHCHFPTVALPAWLVA